ncbi:hypothetical protein Purlil1_4274 [Purpureocillium lilacinum]|uniref:Uncharacterized protein n=1 Tax=Purpureocillium lilacinum TaxID=33203 RepID=A0ABR0C4W5_PURLI|nr:hypothetical protein Purlil1_4274 [Purpureocillium lilacinum]
MYMRTHSFPLILRWPPGAPPRCGSVGACVRALTPDRASDAPLVGPSPAFENIIRSPFCRLFVSAVVRGSAPSRVAIGLTSRWQKCSGGAALVRGWTLNRGVGQMPPSRSALTESMRIDTLMPTYYWPAHALQLSLPNSPRPVSAAPLSPSTVVFVVVIGVVAACTMSMRATSSTR